MKLKVLVLVPYKAMQTAIHDIKGQFPNIDVDVFIGTYTDYKKNAASIEINRYDCVLARGYTYQMLKSSFPLPLTEIKISLYDMLRMITSARMRKVPFAIVASANILEPARQVIDILQYNDISIREIESEEEANEAIGELVQNGIRLIVGDVYAENAAKQYNIASLLVTSSKSSIITAFEEAINTHQQHLAIYQRLSLLDAVMRNDPMFCCVYDEGGNLVCSNMSGFPISFANIEPIFQKMVHLNKEEMLVRELDSYVLKISGRKLELEKNYYAIYIQTSPATAVPEKKGIQVLYPSMQLEATIKENKYQFPFFYTAESGFHLSPHLPSVIVGETGLGKCNLAEYFWCTGNDKNYPLVIIDCSVITSKTLLAYIKNIDHPIHDEKVSLIIRDLHVLPMDAQEVLCSFLEASSFSEYNTVIATSTIHPRKLLEDKKIKTRLCDYLNGNIIEVKSLRQRPDDILQIADFLINKYNFDYGKDVIGLIDEAKEMLQRFPWKSNINQLKVVIRQVISNSNDLFITKEALSNVLRSMEMSDEDKNEIDLTGSLEIIEKRIIKKVLAEENMNYSASARRLGISRATLYRKIEEE